ncbi:MAG: glutaredoxin family protein [Bdellovibrionota bacterium]
MNFLLRTVGNFRRNREAKMTSKFTRSPDEQKKVDAETKKLALYHFDACPFCAKTRRKIIELGLKIEHKDILQDEKAFEELMTGGGQDMEPCLRITGDDGKVTWMYESSDINEYLEKRFGK